MAENVEWLKLMNSMFDDEKIEYIESLPDSDMILIVWIKTLCLASKCNDNGGLTLTSEIPYTPELLVKKFNKTIVEIKYAYGVMEKLGMIYVEDNIIRVSNWCKYQNTLSLDKIREQKRIAQAKWREKQKAQKCVESTVDSTVETLVDSTPSYILNSNNNINNSSNNDIDTIKNDIVSIEDIDNYFNHTYSIYPRKGNKVQAKITFTKKLQGMEKEEAHKQAQSIYQLLQRIIELWKSEEKELKYTPYFSSWLNANVPDSPKKNGKKK